MAQGIAYQVGENLRDAVRVELPGDVGLLIQDDPRVRERRAQFVNDSLADGVQIHFPQIHWNASPQVAAGQVQQIVDHDICPMCTGTNLGRQ
ncbi:hypothetical protein D3C78_1390120 [compost metagenome]